MSVTKRRGITRAPAPGARVLIRDQEWVVRNTRRTLGDDHLIQVTGLSPLVRDQPWQFIQGREEPIVEVDPKKTELVRDFSPNYLAARLHIESLLRTTPPPDEKLYLGHRGAMDELLYQHEPALLALKRPRPRILIADGTGLGKTLEAGILIAELIRRGRGKRILVVSLASMLTQFQKELWSRFSIPLIRLDSVGITRVREQLPAGHNPFHHFDRVIISIDTLKNARSYKCFLKKSNWDIVVIDEVQNVAKKKNQQVSQRYQLADILASRCDSLIMLSATPHDGQAESFASLIKMLDPTVIADEKNYTRDDLEGKNLLIRRFKKDIRDRADFKDLEVELRRATASEEEEHVFTVISDTGHEQLSRRTGDGWLLRTTMEKAVLSSPSACLESVNKRIRKLEKAEKGDHDLRPWHMMKKALENVGAPEFSKYQLLLDIIREWDWTGGDAYDRLLIFTERVATMEFLEKHLASDLRLKGDAIQILHGGLSDVQQQEAVDKFGQDQSRVRLLISTDVGSEGINLHYHCRRLIHFDVPWSLMRFQQRNGRIDRYGQTRKPQIVYLITESENDKFKGDARVLELLIEKESQAEKNLGDPATLMGVFQIEEEEKLVAKTIEQRLSRDRAEEQLTDRSRRLEDDPEFDPLAALLSATPPSMATEEMTQELPSLFKTDYDFSKAALTHIQKDWAERAGAQLKISYTDEKQRIIVVPQNERGQTVLQSVMNQLPVAVRPREKRLALSSDPRSMMESIRRCRAFDNTWPDLHFLWPIHPFMEWVTDKIRMSFNRLESPAVWLSSMAPGTFSYLITVLWPNRKGVTVFQRWYLVTGRTRGPFEISPFEESELYRTLRSRRLSNRKRTSDLLNVAQSRIPEAVDQAKEHALRDRNEFRDNLEVTLKQHLDDLRELEERQQAFIEDTFQREIGIQQVRLVQKQRELEKIRSRFKEFRDWIESSMTMEKEPYIHIAAALLAE